MDEEATQPATQIVIDPRRFGHNNSGLNDEDLKDIICILHPASLSACQAVTQIAESCPEHTISTTGVELKVRGDKKHPKIPNRIDLAAHGIQSRDIALRLSADLKEPLAGFCFGRNPQRCDFIFGNTEGPKRISNVHFRIFINQHGMTMLEDQSTNGTFIENVLLRGKEKDNNKPYKHILQQGSLIKLLMTPPDEDIQFVVRIPQREGDYEAIYEENLQRYRDHINVITEARQAERAEALAVIAAATGDEGQATGAHQGPRDEKPVIKLDVKSDSGRHIKEWRGGSKYNRIGIIGKGAFATVYKICAKFDGTPYAAKELEKRRFMKNGILDQKVDMEMQIMSKIDHPHIVQYVEHIDWGDYLYLIMEYVPHGDLGGLITKRKMLEEDDVKVMATQLLGALKYLHKMGITHRDVKPDNILIQSHDPFHVKLTDFGLSKMVGNDETFLTTFCGTLLYCAPEVYTEYGDYDSTGNRKPRARDKKSLPQQRYDQAVDLWSLGAVLFYALCGKPPYPAQTGTSYQELLNSIMTKPLDIRPLQRANVSDEGIRFVLSMLQINPEHRPNIEVLERSPWFGDVKIAMSDEDEVDMIGETDSEGIEEGASLLSINGADDHEVTINNSQNDDTGYAQPFLGQSQIEMPSSFKTGDSGSSESFAFLRNPVGNPRLFGEVNASALGSSGIIPVEHLNLPVSENGIDQSPSDFDFSATAMDTQNEHLVTPAMMDKNNLSQVNGTSSSSASDVHLVKPQTMESVIAAPSLFGAESMVGQLQMDSPSVQCATTGASTPDNRNFVTSLRRPRDETAATDEDIRPFPKRVRSAREIDIPVSKTVFWSPKDKSTWHNDYPEMMVSQYTEAVEIAKAHGENFVHGEKIFEMYVGSHKKTPSAEPEAQARAQSEPTIEQGRQTMMKRDDRKLEELPHSQPSTSRADTPTLTDLATAQVTERASLVGSNHSLGNDIIFKPPRRILAKFTATADSIIQGINLTITESFTSWGRASYNTVVFSDSKESRIPKSAFKILLWRSGLSIIDSQSHQQDLSFWISTKATMGIRLNGIRLRSHDAKRADVPSREWGELRHGDDVIVWTKEGRPAPYVKLRFECYFGISQTPRAIDVAPFTILPDLLSDELDRYCSQIEQSLNEAAAAKSNSVEEEEYLKGRANHLLVPTQGIGEEENGLY